MTTCEKTCEQCGEYMELSAEVAAHDDGVLDVLLTCAACDYSLNGFLNIAEMIRIESGE